MFQLIVAVTAIAQFMVMTLGGMYYVGEAFTRAQEEAQAEARLKNGGIERTEPAVHSVLPIAPNGWVITDSY